MFPVPVKVNTFLDITMWSYSCHKYLKSSSNTVCVQDGLIYDLFCNVLLMLL